MYTILAILIAIASLLLVGVVLIQKSKGGGLAANVNDYNKFMGVSRTTDFVEKATWWLAGIICVLSIVSSYAVRSTSAEADKPKIERTAADQQQTPIGTANAGQAAQAPAQDAGAAQQPAAK